MTVGTRPFVRDLSSILVPTDSVIDTVVRAIDRAAIGIALLVDEQRRLVATVTDGDVRRAMLAGVEFAEPATRLLEMKRLSSHPVPVCRSMQAGDDEILQAMRDAQVQHIPLLDGEGRVVDVALFEHLVDAAEYHVGAVVMAGGFGERMRPLTDATPKPMLPVGDKPLLERTIEQLRVSGITEVNITTHYLHDRIAEHFGTGAAFGVNVNYVREDRPLGTAGALGLMGRPRGTMLVINGDILTTVDFRAMSKFHRDNAADLTVAVRRYEVRVPYGVVDCDGLRVTGLREKPRDRYLINAGIYLVEPRVWTFITEGEPLDMPQVIERLIASGSIVVSFPIREYWLDIGRPEDYARAQSDIASGNIDG